MSKTNDYDTSIVRTTRHTANRIVKLLQEFQTFFQAGEDRELPLEWILTEKKIEHGVVLCLARLPVRVGHGYLIEICQ